MFNPITALSLPDDALVAAAHDLARRSCAVEADLLAHLAEIDARKLWAARAFDSMFAFCVSELGFSEGAAYLRITIARAATRFPAILDAVRSRKVHLAGVRLLLAHMNDENHGDLLARAAGKSKREIEELVAAIAPRPAAPTVIRKLPRALPAALPLGALPLGTTNANSSSREARIAPPGAVAATTTPNAARRQAVAPLSADTFKIQFTAMRAFRDKLREAQDLLRHRVPDGDLEAILGAALDLLVSKLKKERFAVARKPRASTAPPERPATRHVPAAIARAVYERDAGRCAFVDERGHRCQATSPLEFHHVQGFARTHAHSAETIRLSCRAHNQYEAERMYGRAFMERARGRRGEPTRPGASPGGPA